MGRMQISVAYKWELLVEDKRHLRINRDSSQRWHHELCHDVVGEWPSGQRGCGTYKLIALAVLET